MSPTSSLLVQHDRPSDDARGAFLAALAHRVVAVVGYGNQGSAHALNLRDAGVRIVVGARAGSDSARRAGAAGFEVMAPAEAAASAHLIIVGAPDHVQPALCRDVLIPAMREGSTLGFMHGFALRFGGLTPRGDLGAVLVAPKGPGAALRQRFLEGRGIPCLLAVHQESCRSDAEALALGWASGLGCGRAGIVRTTVADETETDLFGEQAVLCGGAVALARAGYETLVEAGYPPELAYVECVHELKQVVDLLFEQGIAGMYARVSDTAEFGGRRAGPRIVDDAVRTHLRELLAEIRDGRFARAMAEDHARGFAWLEADRTAGREAAIEAAGRAVRGWMPWLGERPAG